MEINVDISNAGLTQSQIKAQKNMAEKAMEELWSEKKPYTGWVKLPLYYDKDLLEQMLVTADIIRQQCDLLIVIGTGGSYLGARGIIEALPTETGSPQVKFAGINLSAAYHKQLLSEVREKEVCLCVVSKSGTTVEIQAAYHIFKKALIKKYGEEKAKKRIYTVTDPKEGALREETEKQGYVSFDIPANIGGRYSVLTPAGLFPAACGGVDIRRILRGAEKMASSTQWDFTGPDYAIARFLLSQKQKTVEIFQYYEPCFQYFVEWVKQLFGESEGKQGKGLFPAGVNLTADLHSMGQFLQEGNQIFFETILDIKNTETKLSIPEGPLKGNSLENLNKIAVKGVMAAHKKAQIPMIHIEIPERNPYYYGQLLYYFQTTCAITAKMMGVNPFDQPGVEAYKKEMKKEIS